MTEIFKLIIKNHTSLNQGHTKDAAVKLTTWMPLNQNDILENLLNDLYDYARGVPLRSIK